MFKKIDTYSFFYVLSVDTMRGGTLLLEYYMTSSDIILEALHRY